MKDKKFLEELQALLDAYKASISFSVSWCSDTHGLSEERMVVEIENKEIASVDGWSLTAYDLRSEV